MNYLKALVLGTSIAILTVVAIPAGAETSTTTASTTVAQVENLLKQIKILQDQLSQLQGKQADLRTEIKTNLQLARELTLGMSGEDVKLLQELLATDPSIYPEGIVSGYFGALTEKAVKRLQEKDGLESVGRVGPKTRARLNELLANGAGNSGKIPPGLLIAPGIWKKMGTSTVPSPLPGQVLPPGIAKKLNGQATTTKDTTAPVISSLTASSTASTTLSISWTTNESTKGRVWLSTTTPVSISGAATAASGSYKTSHMFDLSNLMASTTYYYVVSAEDSSGNLATSTEKSVMTTN